MSRAANALAMLIVKADDWGRSCAATDRALECHRAARITAASAMVFMQDSERGAELGSAAGLDTGLHINLTEPFTGGRPDAAVREAHVRICRFLGRSKYALLLYHPALCREFATVFQAQLDEFRRLYGKDPSHYDGHQHMHLCTNMLLQRILPAGSKVRRSFSFRRGERNALNRAYRAWVDKRLAMRHRMTDFFFALDCARPADCLRTAVSLAEGASVEWMTHPEREPDYRFLMSETFTHGVGSARLAGYVDL